MKKMIKNPIFTFVLGLVIATVVGVYAINASEIDYKETNVESALDTLYQRSTYTEYDGSTEVTPTSTSQTLSTNNKLLKSNITINAIPSTFKELTTTTTVTANNLLSGETAYNNLGELITGNISTDCVKGSFTCTTCNTSAGYTVPGINFTVNELVILGKQNGTYQYIEYYNKLLGDTLYQYGLASNRPTQTFVASTYLETTNKLVLKNWTNMTIYYVACK